MNYLFTDGGSRGNPGNSACACFLFNEDMTLITFDAEFLGIGTNNLAEYTALKLGLKLAQKQNITEITCKLDSELVVKQLNGEYQVKDENMKKLYKEVINLKSGFKTIDFIHVRREENKHADKLVNIILDSKEKETI